jgi:hypothetical protein
MFDPYHKWLGIPPKDRPPNHYRLLSLELYENDPDVIEGAADRLMGFIRQYQSGEHAASAANLLNEIATARLCLLKPVSKSEYDTKLKKELATKEVRQEEVALASLNLARETAELPDLPVISKRTPAIKRKKSKKRHPQQSKGIAVAVVFVAGILLIAFYMKAVQKNPVIEMTQESPKAAGETAEASRVPQPQASQSKLEAVIAQSTVQKDKAIKAPAAASNSETLQIGTPEKIESTSPETQATSPHIEPRADDQNPSADPSLRDVKLKNSSFETELEPAWKLETFVPWSQQVKIVNDLAKSGKYSLLFKADKPDDIRCLQIVAVKSNTRYRLSGWAKTAKVTVIQEGGGVGAVLSVSELGLSSSLIGDNDWTELNFEFDTGPLKQIELGPRLGFFGSVCTGAAWFDDIRLTEMAPRLQ